MDSLSFKTLFVNKYFIRKQRVFYLINACDCILGRLTSNIIKIITGKDKPYYTPHVICGDNIIIINANKIRLTGSKLLNKKYIRYTGYPGGQRYIKCKDQLSINASKVILSSIKGMLPKSKLYRRILNHIHIFNGPTHNITHQYIKKIVV